MENLRLNLVVAACSNRGIGFNGGLPWRLKGDMTFFKEITSSTTNPVKKNAVIMGHKTWKSIPDKFRPLPNRFNVVLSRVLSEAPNGACLARSLDEALQLVESRETSIENIYVIGGSSVYEAALNHPSCYRIYLTNILQSFECDTFLPEIEMEKYKVVSDDRVPTGVHRENEISYEFHVLEKVS